MARLLEKHPRLSESEVYREAALQIVRDRNAVKAKNQKQRLRDYKLEARFKKYGLTSDIFFSMLSEQKGKCQICYGSITADTANIDHCHRTDAVRGLLCRNCNLGLGYFSDEISRLSNAIQYLRGSRK